LGFTIAISLSPACGKSAPFVLRHLARLQTPSWRVDCISSQ
jgi:hypothetical protein